MHSTRNSISDIKDQDFDKKFKILMLGNAMVGKTSFLVRYTEGVFRDATISTVGMELANKVVFRDNKKIKLEIWDTVGQERFRSITRGFYRKAMGFVMMYDISDRKSLDDVPGWLNEAERYSNDNVPVVLVGNKCDCEAKREVTYKQGQELAEELGCPFFEASVKDSVNVNRTFEKLTDVIVSSENERATGESESTNHVDAITGVVACANTGIITLAIPTIKYQWCRWC